MTQSCGKRERQGKLHQNYPCERANGVQSDYAGGLHRRSRVVSIVRVLRQSASTTMAFAEPRRKVGQKAAQQRCQEVRVLWRVDMHVVRAVIFLNDTLLSACEAGDGCMFAQLVCIAESVSG